MLIEPTVNAASITVTSSSGSWSAGGGSGSSSGTGSSGEGSGGSAGTSVSGDTNDGTLPARTGSTTERSDGPPGGSDSQGTSPDGSAAVDTSVGLPTQVPSPAGSIPISSLWIIVIAIMVGAAAAVLYLAVTRRI